MIIPSRLLLKEADLQTDSLLSVSALPLPSDGYKSKIPIKIIECPWKNPTDIQNAFKEIQSLYENVLNIVSGQLNTIHHVQYPQIYWRILIGPWLNTMVHVIYDRYKRLVLAKEKQAGSLLIPPRKILGRIPRDSLESAQLINHDERYNLLLTLDVASQLGYPIKITHVKFSDETQFLSHENPIRKISFKSKIYKFFTKLLSKYSEVFIYTTPYSSVDFLKLNFKSKGKIVEMFSSEKNNSENEIDFLLRKAIVSNYKNSLIKQNDFINIITITVLEHMPICWLEGFKDLQTNVLKYFPSKIPKTIITAIGWYYSEMFKMWAALCKLQGTKLIGMQHGGNYGINEFLASENHEIKVSDQYFTWGWQKQKNKKCMPIVSAKCYNAKKALAFSRCNMKEKILFASTTGCRFLIQFPDLPENFQRYMDEQISFIKNLSSTIRDDLFIRTHLEDRLWETKNRLINHFSDLKFDDMSLSFVDSLKESQLFITDYLSTTFCESLASNKPTILFYHKGNIKLTRSAISIFDKLSEVGILHYSPEKAAKFLNLIYSDIGGWWYSKNVQDAVDQFCDNFARNNENPIDSILKALYPKNQKYMLYNK